jgi:hypothetical protein
LLNQPISHTLRPDDGIGSVVITFTTTGAHRGPNGGKL